jgi:rhomboid protease GluP
VTFATYLAQYYIARKGFSAGAVPEAAALAEASDIVLTHNDGLSMQILCIVDRETNPGKVFGLSDFEMLAIGEPLLKYTGSVGSQKIPVTIQVMEVGGSPTAEDRKRLGAFKLRSAFGKVLLYGWALDPAAGRVWTNAPFRGLFAGRRALEQLMREPRVAQAELQQPQAVFERERFPLLTIALLAVLAAVFACEIAFGIGEWSGPLKPSIQTLVALGGLNRGLVLEAGEWYRIFSAALLHGDLFHLVLNGICLYLAGTVLENLVGRRWFFALFVIGAVCGSLASLALNPPSVVSVGASGAIMGLLAAAFVTSLRYPPGALRTQIQMMAVQVLIPALIPLAVSRTGQHIDFAAHAGGALSGALGGLVLLKTWRADSTRPAFLPLAGVVCAAGALAFTLSMAQPARTYRGYTLDMQLIPSAQLPKSDAEVLAKAADLLARYPRDPRARLYQAEALAAKRDFRGAERELRAALAEKEILGRFKPELQVVLQGMVALTLNDQYRIAEAKDAAQPVCALKTQDIAHIRNQLVQARLCAK